jgi:feruloyl esterase
MSFMTPPNPNDMGAVKRRGAKILAYHGTSDPIFSSDDTASWYNALVSFHGGNTAQFARYFQVPGMNHCAGGPSTDQFDMLSPLVAWVENGVAPDSVTASARGTGNAGGVNADVPSSWAANRTRPLCPFPQVARYKGSGSLESADSFECR